MGSTRLHWALAVIVLYALIGVASLSAPEAVLRAAAKEGAIEQVSHALLVVAIAVWSSRVRIRPRWPAVAIAVVLAVVLGEEFDWGALDGGTSPGGANLHTAWSGAAYVLFAAPWLAWYALPFAPAGFRARVGSHAPGRDESLAAAIVAVVALVSSLAPIEWERALDEIDETILYILVLASGLRPRGSGGS